MAKRPKGKRVRGIDGSFTVSGKAANGEGSLYRELDGAWRATYRVPGESRPRRVRGRTREQALRRRAEALTKALTEGPRPSTTALGASSTIAEFAAWWLNTVAAVRVRPSSLGKYVDRVERITAWLGDVRIGSLRPEQVATWQSELLSSLSAKTVADTRATFRSVVAEAVNLGLIPTNPVDRVRPPKTRASARRALTAAEARAVVAAGAEDRLGAAIALLFVQGCIATDQFSSVVDSGRCCGRTAESSFPITNAWDLTGPGTARRSKNGTASFRTRMPIHRAVTNGTMKLGDGGVHGERAGQLIPGTWCARWMGRADRVSLRDG